MKITEITGQSQKIIKRLSRLYISYTIDPRMYDTLINFMDNLAGTTDADIAREVELIFLKLQEELIRILSK